jgi:hypothetical protein
MLGPITPATIEEVRANADTLRTITNPDKVQAYVRLFKADRVKKGIVLGDITREYMILDALTKSEAEIKAKQSPLWLALCSK